MKQKTLKNLLIVAVVFVIFVMLGRTMDKGYLYTYDEVNKYYVNKYDGSISEDIYKYQRIYYILGSITYVLFLFYMIWKNHDDNNENKE